eukprot:gene41649-65888_t
MFKLKNREFTFDVDVSALPCGLNGALYFVDMDADGGMSKYPGNKAGAKYGTGYCDAQCPQDVKFINGEANSEGWAPSASDPNSGKGKYGACCTEMDIWESNQWASAFTPHACSVDQLTRCSGTDCGAGADRFNGVCDKNGCDFQTFRLGDKGFFGPGSNHTVDSTKPVTVVTQFITSDGTDTGDLAEIRRVWVQGGKVIDTPKLSVGGEGPYNSISDKFCASELKSFADNTNFLQKGGLKQMGKAMDDGVVLVMSLWDDHDPFCADSAPSGCPAGSLTGCMNLCPSSPAVAYKACVDNCCGGCCCGAGLEETEEAPGAALTRIRPRPRRLWFLASAKTRDRAAGAEGYDRLLAAHGGRVGWLDERAAIELWRRNATKFSYSRVDVQVMK